MNFGSEFLLLGLIVVGMGAVLWFAARFILNGFQRNVLPDSIREYDSTQGLEQHERPVILVAKGGYIKAINQAARNLFNYNEDQIPTLETLARRVRPAEAFYQVSSEASEMTVTVEGSIVDALSYPISEGMLVIFQGRSFGAVSTQPHTITSKTLITINQMTNLMAASEDLEETMLAILENVFKIVPADLGEICVWDSQKMLITPYRLLREGETAGQLIRIDELYQKGEGYSGHILSTQQPLFVPDILNYSEVRPAIDLSRYPLQTFMGFPLMVGNNVIGTLGVASYTRDAFTSDDREVLLMVSGPAAIAVYNSILFSAEQQRAAEMTGLAQLAQSFSATRDPQKLFDRILESIEELVSVEMLGFLLYNENTHMLEAQVPFHGLPDQFVELFKTEVVQNSAAEQLILAQDVLMTENAAEDEHWQNLGLGHLARAASIRDSVLLPLTSGGTVLGFLHAANYKKPGGFSQDDLRLLMIIANQAAPVIENATLVYQSRQRTQRAEVLRRIASLASSNISVEEVLTYSLRELAQLLRADYGFVLLMNRDRTSLNLHNSSVYGSLENENPLRIRILSDDAQFPFTMTGSQKTLVVGEFDDTKPLVPFYQQMIEAWKIQSAVIVPLISRNEGIGELWLGSTLPNFYDQGDVQVIIPAASQIASFVEQSNLFSQTDESLRRRVEQLTALARVSRDLSTSLDLNFLLQQLYEEMLALSKADSGGLILFNLNQDNIQFNPETYMVYGDIVPSKFSDYELNLIKNGSPLLINDCASEKRIVFPQRIQSALFVPVHYRQNPAALITLYHRNSEHFQQTDLEIIQSLAAQGAVALGNAWQYQEQIKRADILKRELDFQEKFFQISEVLRPGQPFEVALDVIAQAILDTTPFTAVLMSVYDPEIKALRRISGRGLPEESWNSLKAQNQSWDAVENILKDEYKFNSVYFIPNDKMPVVPADIFSVTILKEGGVSDQRQWHPNDLCFMPLFDLDGNPLGLISVDAPDNGLRPDLITFEALEMFSIQTALLLENQRYHASLEEKVNGLEEEKTQTGTVLATQQRRILTAMQAQLDRFSKGLEISANASRQENQKSILSIFANELITQLGFKSVIIAEKTGPLAGKVKTAFGEVPEAGQIEAAFGQRNPLHEVMEKHTSIWSSLLEEDEIWQKSTLLKTLQAKSFLAIAYPVSEQKTIGVLAVSQEPLIFQDNQEAKVFTRLFNQIGIALQNEMLLFETRKRLGEVDHLLDFSRKLGSLDPQEILQVLLTSSLEVVSDAQAGWAALWDDQAQALIPQSALGYGQNDQILSLKIERAFIPQLFGVFDSRIVKRGDEVDFAECYKLSPDDLMRYRQANHGQLPVSNMFVPINIGDQSLGVLVLENFIEAYAFDQEDENLVSSLAQQTALALENARLFLTAQHRSDQLQALTNVGSTITSSLESKALIANLLDFLSGIVAYNTATLWLREEDQLSVMAANGFEDDEDRVGLSAALEDSLLFQQMSQDMQPISVPDVRKDERFPSLIEPDYLSWLGIPLISKSSLIGVIALEKLEAGYYTRETVQIALTFASQAAVALENARLFEDSAQRTLDLDQRSQRLALLNRFSGDVAASMDEELILKKTLQQLLEAVNLNQGAVIVPNEKSVDFIVCIPKFTQLKVLSGVHFPVFDHLMESQGLMIVPEVEIDKELGELSKKFLSPRGTKAVVILPLLTATTILGWVLLESQEIRRFTPGEIELMRTLTNQAAVAVQNARLLTETRSLTEDLEKRVEERTAEMMREHHNSQTLLRITTELSASLDIKQVLQRTLSVLNESMQAQSSLIILAQSDHFYHAGQKTFSLDEMELLPADSPEKTIARWVMRERVGTLVDNLQEDKRWSFSKTETPGFTSLLGVPLKLGEELLGALLLTHQEKQFFMIDQIDLVEATARQISVALNNAELFNLIRDQSENLGSMLREQQIEASRSRAILEAVADGVLVTDAENKINLLNQSAANILELNTKTVLGKNLEDFKGVFGSAANDWLSTIRTWTLDPTSYIFGDTYAEQVTLDNDRIISIHLAPVIWRSEFLGTVSVFRDITVEVQVDRMKSEFITNVSHELRTPLTAIKGYVDIMLMGASGVVNDQQKQFLDVIRTNAIRLGVLVNDILDVSQIETGHMDLNLRKIDLEKVSTEVIKKNRERSEGEQKPMAFDLVIEENLPQAYGDLERVFQIINNLVNNAFTYTPANGNIQVKLSRKEAMIQIDVIDNGIGISNDIRDRVFERFYRGEDPLVMASSGTGLGLAVAKTLVEMHKGEIWFESSGVPGEGSVFSFTLPVYQAEEKND